MAYYKRRYTKRRKTYKNRTYRRRFKRKTMRRGHNQPVHYFKRFVDRGTVAADITDPFLNYTILGYRFSLTDVPGYTEFTTMYDFYKIVAVKIMWIPISNVSQILEDNVSYQPTPNTFNYYRTFSAIDYNDNIVSGLSLNELRQYSNCKVTKGNSIHKRYFYPKISTVIGEDITTSAQAGQGSPWISISNPNIDYYGVKFGFEQTAGELVSRFRVEARYYLKFKGKR